MRAHSLFVTAISIATALMAGCSSSPTPQSAPPPGAEESIDGSTDVEHSTGFSRIVSGAGDSVGAVPGSSTALYRYRFKQTDPSSDRFTFQDRDLSFYFKPSPSALFFQIENRQDRPVWIDWDRSSFDPPLGSPGKIAHASTLWRDRFAVQSQTQILGLQRYGDYVLPLDYLIDSAGSETQLHRALFPEDRAAQQYVDSDFGVDLVMRIDERFRTYTFRFKVVSVNPR